MSVTILGAILPEPSKDTPPIVRAVAKVVAFPAVRLAAVPDTLVITPEAGVPRAGVTKVGDVAKVNAPDPVSLDITPASCADVVDAN